MLRRAIKQSEEAEYSTQGQALALRYDKELRVEVAMGVERENPGPWQSFFPSQGKQRKGEGE